MFSALKIQIPEELISRVEYYNQSLRVYWSPKLVGDKKVRETPLISDYNRRQAALMHVRAVNAMHFYQQCVFGPGMDTYHWNHSSVIKNCNKEPKWIDLPYYKGRGHGYNVWDTERLALFLNPESPDFKPFVCHYMTFLVDNEYLYVFTQEPDKNKPWKTTLYCTCVDYDLNTDNIRKILACWRTTKSYNNTPNPFARNSFNQKAMLASAPFLHTFCVLPQSK